jgi:hypothetical protein
VPLTRNGNRSPSGSQRPATPTISDRPPHHNDGIDDAHPEPLCRRSRVRSVKARPLLACGLVAGPLFTVAWIIEGVMRPTYNPLRHPISALALGDLGWTQIANFIVTGLLTLAFAIGLRRALRPPGGSTWGRCWSAQSRSACLAPGSSSPTR